MKSFFSIFDKNDTTKVEKLEIHSIPDELLTEFCFKYAEVKDLVQKFDGIKNIQEVSFYFYILNDFKVTFFKMRRNEESLKYVILAKF